MSESTFDMVLVGGGLQNGLIALSTLHQQPDARIAIVEAEVNLGGNHRWCFYSDDVPTGAQPWLSGLPEVDWASYDVRFPKLSRTLMAPSATFDGARLHQTLSAMASRRQGLSLHLGCKAAEVATGIVTLTDGRTLRAPLIVDARGPQGLKTEGPTAFQKFVGLEVVVKGAPMASRPTIMDATVEQVDGFRFMYTLPLSADRVMLEDTYFSDSPNLDRERSRQTISDYAAGRGWTITEVVRQESGVLALPRRAVPIDVPQEGVFRAGYGGGWFHPTTGYSFPCAAAVAHAVGAHLATDALGPALKKLSRNQRRQHRFAIMLNRLLFGAFDPSHRHHVLERFYSLPEPTIRRFYALQTTTSDRGRIICGRPPEGFSLRLALSGAN